MSSFVFNEENLKKKDIIFAKYPENYKKSAILPLFDLAQRQNNNYLSRECIEYVADLLELPYIRALEVASFYSMFNLKPVGKYHIQVCGTTPCWLRGAADLMKTCQSKLKIKKGETTPDNLFTLSEVECLGACVNAPIVQINDDFFEDLNIETLNKIIDDLGEGKDVKIGSKFRTSSAPHDET